MLDASGTIDLSGRIPQFNWTLTALNPAATGSLVATATSLDAYVKGSLLSVPPTSLAPGGVYTVTVTATTFLKANSSLAVFVSVKSAPVPNVYIVSATNVTVVANRRLSLQAVGTQSVSTGACNRPADAIKYQWDVTSVSAIPGATVDGYTPAPLSSLTAYVTRDPTTVLLPLLQVRALLTWAA